jgi:antitoxin StbD
MASPISSFAPTRVLTTTEAREAMPGIAQRFHQEGLGSEIVFYGAHRRAEAAIVPVALLEALAPYLEDLVLAETLRARRSEDTGIRYTLDELDDVLEFDRDAVASAKAQLARDLGLGS